MAVPCVVVARHFNPRTPCGARRVPADDGHRWQQISIHAPLAGRDDLIRQQQDILANFNPRAPCGARRSWPSSAMSCAAFQSTRPLRGATRPRAHGCVRGRRISIHAPLAGRDNGTLLIWGFVDLFQSTRPLRGATFGTSHIRCLTDQFQSTRPLRGATQFPRYVSHPETYFNPRAPCGARPGSRFVNSRNMSDFNPRAPCGARLGRRSNLPLPSYFNPRAPCGARRYQQLMPRHQGHFNPRAPCGARLKQSTMVLDTVVFQSTRPLRGAT